MLPRYISPGVPQPEAPSAGRRRVGGRRDADGQHTRRAVPALGRPRRGAASSTMAHASFVGLNARGAVTGEKYLARAGGQQACDVGSTARWRTKVRDGGRGRPATPEALPARRSEGRWREGKPKAGGWARKITPPYLWRAATAADRLMCPRAKCLREDLRAAHGPLAATGGRRRRASATPCAAASGAAAAPRPTKLRGAQPAHRHGVAGLPLKTVLEPSLLRRGLARHDWAEGHSAGSPVARPDLARLPREDRPGGVLAWCAARQGAPRPPARSPAG